MTCIKQTVTATLVTPAGEKFVGTNACSQPQETCPRDLEGYKSGKGYHLCKEVCGQRDHAEVAAIRLATNNVPIDRLIHSTIYLEGHIYACEPCKMTAKAYGVNIIVGEPPHEN
jgi:hypothetical protein